ncbi:MAG TPA: DUF262 domain-containing protein [Candidatus Nanoarchaeia archaeon]|nr:DUF262 domain-containing protein [Candidatus Nanoarchaeia archaeon]
MIYERSNNVESIPDEEEDFYSEENPYETLSWGADLSFRELITMFESGELIKPEIQRNYVWDKLEASRFIESLLLGLPVPSIFLAKKADQKLIVDGFQRIMTVFDFTKGIFSKDGSIFKLSNTSKISSLWKGKSFSQLTESEQRRILSTTIHAIIFVDKKKERKDSILYQVFERINSSGRTLAPQEIRNCIYQGKFNSLLIKLNKIPSWRKLYDSEIDSRMLDIEFILRFFTLSDEELLKKEINQISLKKELNLCMGDESANKIEILEKREKDFANVMDFILKNIGEKAFRNLSKTKEGIIKEEKTLSTKFFPTVFDSISIATLFALRKNSNIDVKELEKRRLDLLSDEKFIGYSTIRTTNIQNIRGRISLALKYLYGM